MEVEVKLCFSRVFLKFQSLLTDRIKTLYRFVNHLNVLPLSRLIVCVLLRLMFLLLRNTLLDWIIDICMQSIQILPVNMHTFFPRSGRSEDRAWPEISS